MHFTDALFETALVAFGTGLYFVMEATKKWIAWVVMIVGAGGMLYSVFRTNSTDSLGLPLWSYLLTATWILVGLDIYDRKVKNKSRNQKGMDWRQGFIGPRFEIVDDHKFENEEIAVDNKSFRRCSFKNVKLLFHGSAPFEFVEGTTIDAGNVIFVTDDPAILTFNAIQRKFASVPGAQIQHGSLDSKGKDVPFSPVTVEPVATPLKPLQYPIPVLRLKVFEICSALQGFLGTYGEEPKVERQLPESQEDFMKRFRETVSPWRAKVNGNFRLTFGESIPRLRDEISARAGLNMSFLDIAINGAATNVNHPVEAIKKLLKTLEEMAWEVNT